MSDRRNEHDETRLDSLLEGWAAAQRLGASEADQLRRAVLGEPRTVVESRPRAAPERPAVLPATWWSELSAQISAAVVLASSRPGTFPELSRPSTVAA